MFGSSNQVMIYSKRCHLSREMESFIIHFCRSDESGLTGGLSPLPRRPLLKGGPNRRSPLKNNLSPRRAFCSSVKIESKSRLNESIMAGKSFWNRISFSWCLSKTFRIASLCSSVGSMIRSNRSMNPSGVRIRKVIRLKFCHIHILWSCAPNIIPMNKVTNNTRIVLYRVFIIITPC